MRRSPAEKAMQAADALHAWLDGQPKASSDLTAPDLHPATGPGPECPGAASGHSSSMALAAPDRPEQAGQAGTATRGRRRREFASPLQPAHTDWLHHRLTIAGPPRDIAAFRDRACGAGTIPWRLDLERLEEDWFHLLVSPPAPQSRKLSFAAARIVAGQLRAAVARRDALATARVGRSHACPFDLHALIPVPDDVLRLGPDDPDAHGWLWEHWGTTQALRHVTLDRGGEDGIHLSFWSGDWTPWRAMRRLASEWPTLRYDVRPAYERS